jgi:hypothetical protein
VLAVTLRKRVCAIPMGLHRDCISSLLACLRCFSDKSCACNGPQCQGADPCCNAKEACLCDPNGTTQRLHHTLGTTPAVTLMSALRRALVGQGHASVTDCCVVSSICSERVEPNIRRSISVAGSVSGQSANRYPTPTYIFRAKLRLNSLLLLSAVPYPRVNRSIPAGRHKPSTRVPHSTKLARGFETLVPEHWFCSYVGTPERMTEISS